MGWHDGTPLHSLGQVEKGLETAEKEKAQLLKKKRFRFDKDAVPGHQARSPGRPGRD